MDVRELEDLIDRLGEDLALWPDAQRAAAVDLLAASPEARTIVEEARTFRRALTSPVVRAPAGLADRIVLAASRLRQIDVPATEPDVEPSVRVTQPS